MFEDYWFFYIVKWVLYFLNSIAYLQGLSGEGGVLMPEAGHLDTGTDDTMQVRDRKWLTHLDALFAVPQPQPWHLHKGSLQLSPQLP